MTIKRNFIYLTAILSLTILSTVATFAKKSSTKELTTKRVEYKSVEGSDPLIIEIVAQEGYDKGRTKKAIVFYFGGGWVHGSIEAFRHQAEYFADQGLVSFLVQYRTRNSHKTTPKEALYDAKTAIRYIKTHAKEFNIDADDLITSGGSAGGQLAAAVGMCPNINDPQDDLSISTDVTVNVLFNPVVCNGAGKSGADKGYGYNMVKDYYKDFSPYYNVREGVPSTIFIVGSNDRLIDTEVAYEYKRRIEAVGGRCDVSIHEGQPHGFFNSKVNTKDMTMFAKTIRDAHNFLVDLGYIKGECQVERWIDRRHPDYKY